MNYSTYKRITQYIIRTTKVFSVLDWFGYFILSLLTIFCLTACTSDGNGSVPATQLPTVSSRLILGRITTIPLSSSTKKMVTYLPLVNNSKATLVLTGLYLKTGQKALSLVRDTRLFDAEDCKTLQPGAVCKITISPQVATNYLLEVLFKDNTGTAYKSTNLISITKTSLSYNGFTYLDDNPELVWGKGDHTALSIPFILDDNYSDISVSVSDKRLPTQLLCSGSGATAIKYTKGTMCTALIDIPNAVYKEMQSSQLRIEGVYTTQDALIYKRSKAEATLNFTLTNNSAANLITSATNVVIKPADGNSGNAQTIYLYNNTATTQAVSINVTAPYPLVVANSCTSLNAGSSCSFTINVITGLTASGENSVTMTYSNGSTSQVINFNTEYIVPAPAPALTIVAGGNFLNVPVSTTVRYVAFSVTNSGNTPFTNLQFNTLQNTYMSYDAAGTTCVTGQSLAVNASCTMVIGYYPTSTQTTSSIYVIPVVSYDYNGSTLTYNASSISVSYSTVSSNNFVVAGDYGSIATANALATWSATYNPPFSTNNIIANQLIMGNGLYLIASSCGYVWSSIGGLFWTSSTNQPNGNNTVVSVAYNGTNYLTAGGPSSRTVSYATSLTGTWANSQTITSGAINQLYANANYSIISTTSLGIYATTTPTSAGWTRSLVLGTSLIPIINNGTTYYTMGASGITYYSTTPTSTWTAGQVVTAAFTTRGVVYAGGLYVAVGNGSSSDIYTTTNPQSVAWTARLTNATQLNSVAYGNSTYVAVGNGGAIYSSSNGTSWTAQTSGTTSNLTSVYFDGTLFWATGTAIILTSSNGTTWARASINSIAYTGSNFIAVGVGGLIYTATSLSGPWTKQTSGTNNTLNYATCLSSTSCIAVGNAGTILTSTNGGSSWTSQVSGTSNNLNGFTCGIKYCVIVGNIGTILYADLGVLNSWTVVSPPTANNLNDVAYMTSQNGAGNNLYVAVGANGTIYTSKNVKNWSSWTSGTTNALNGIICPSTTSVACVVVGASGTILTSINGTSWTPQTSGTTNTLNGIFYNNNNYIIAGNSNTILTSSNSTAWTSQNSNIGAGSAINFYTSFSY